MNWVTTGQTTSASRHHSAETGIEPRPGQKGGARQRCVWPLQECVPGSGTHGEQPAEWCRDAEVVCPVVTQFIRQCQDNAINQALLTLGRFPAAERCKATGQGMLKKLRQRAVSLLRIDRRQEIQPGVREVIQVSLEGERQQLFVEAGVHGAFLAYLRWGGFSASYHGSKGDAPNTPRSQT